MVPAANLIGFGGEELARKIPKVIGIVVETTLGSIVEIVLFAILITKPATETFNPVQIIQAAILGSVLANLLLCIGLCFYVGCHVMAAGNRLNFAALPDAAVWWVGGRGRVQLRCIDRPRVRRRGAHSVDLGAEALDTVDCEC